MTIYYAAIILVVLSCIWVGVDARERGVRLFGRLMWMLGCFLVWIVFFPAWLIFRPRLTAPVVVAPTPPPGWYRDPDGHGQRWFDGQAWTDFRA